MHRIWDWFFWLYNNILWQNFLEKDRPSLNLWFYWLFLFNRLNLWHFRPWWSWSLIMAACVSLLWTLLAALLWNWGLRVGFIVVSIVIRKFFVLKRKKGTFQVTLTHNHRSLPLVNILEKFQTRLFATELWRLGWSAFINAQPTTQSTVYSNWWSASLVLFSFVGLW